MINRNRLLKALGITSLCAISAGGGIAADSKSAEQPKMTYLHLYNDSKGDSHFKEAHFSFATGSRVGGPLSHEIPGANGAALLRLEPGAKEDWHTAPRRWFLIAVQGMSEVTASDGQVRRLTPGMIMLMDDTSGKGHQTRAVGPEAHIAIVIPVPADSTVDSL